ncbi:MAG: SlyX family protein [Pirellulales bacterium]
MNAEHPDATPTTHQLHARVVELEVLFTHLQRTLADLDQVALAQQKQIAKLERAVASLRGELDGLAGAAQEARTPEEEKPPHY